MRIFFVGGTRFMGPHAVAELAAAGHELTVFHRGKSDNLSLEGIQHIHGDRRDPVALAEALGNVQPEVIVDMMCLTEAESAQLVSATIGVARRIVMISSIDVYAAFGRLIGIEAGAVDNAQITELSPLRTKNYQYRGAEPRAGDDRSRIMDYYDKILVENVVRAASHLEHVILRLPMVYGPHDGQRRLTPYLHRMLDNRPAIIMDTDSAEWKTSRSHCANVGHAIALAAVLPQAAGRTYNVAEAHGETEREWVERIGSACGWDGQLVVRAAEDLPPALRPDSPPLQNIFASSQCLRDELGFIEVVPLCEALKATVTWESATMPERPIELSTTYASEDEFLLHSGLMA